MSSNNSGLICSGLAICVLLSCQPKEEKERPGSITIGGAPGPAATPQQPNDDNPDPTTDGTIEGAVVQFLGDSFNSTTAFPGSAEVTITGLGSSASVETTYDGVDFVAEGAVFGDRWVYVEPEDETAFPTITWQRLGDAEASIPVVPRTVLDEIFQNITTPVAFNRARAHFLLRVIESGGGGVSGVVADGFAAPQTVAYKQGASWPDYLDATTQDGIALVPNLEAPAYPGQVTTMVLTGAINEEIDVRLALGAITVITVVMP